MMTSPRFRGQRRREWPGFPRPWQEWVTQDPANARLDVLPSVWPVRGFRHDIAPTNFAARLGLFSFDSGTPITSNAWAAASTGVACAIDAARALASDGRPRAAVAPTRPPGHHAGADLFFWWLLFLVQRRTGC